MSPHVIPIAVQTQVISQKFDENKPGTPLQTIKEIRQGPSLYTQDVVLYCENLLGHAKIIQTEI